MVSNSEFLSAVYGPLDSGRHGWIASFRGDPNAVAADAWAGQLYVGTANQQLLIDKRSDDNNYYLQCYNIHHLRLNYYRMRNLRYLPLLLTLML